MKRWPRYSPRTTWAGALTGIALVLFGTSAMLRGEEISAEGLLAILAGASSAAQGFFTRDRDETDEGTNARVNRRLMLPPSENGE